MTRKSSCFLFSRNVSQTVADQEIVCSVQSTPRHNHAKSLSVLMCPEKYDEFLTNPSQNDSEWSYQTVMEAWEERKNSMTSLGQVFWGKFLDAIIAGHANHRVIEIGRSDQLLNFCLFGSSGESRRQFNVYYRNSWSDIAQCFYTQIAGK
jgi:hypothetical protein